MKKLLLASAFAALTLSTSFASDGDLSLPGARWASKFTSYVCADGNVQAAGVPAVLAERNVVFGQMLVDYSLDNVLIKATFNEGDAACSYSAILLADNAAWTISLVESRAITTTGTSSCAEGKAVLDAALTFNKYAYLHGRAAIFAAVPGSEIACGAGSTTTGLHFQATGKL